MQKTLWKLTRGIQCPNSNPRTWNLGLWVSPTQLGADHGGPAHAVSAGVRPKPNSKHALAETQEHSTPACLLCWVLKPWQHLWVHGAAMMRCPAPCPERMTACSSSSSPTYMPHPWRGLTPAPVRQGWNTSGLEWVIKCWFTSIPCDDHAG